MDVVFVDVVEELEVDVRTPRKLKELVKAALFEFVRGKELVTMPGKSFVIMRL